MRGSWWWVVGGGWQWLAVGGWSLVAVGGSWRLAVGGPLGRSLRAVLNKKKEGGGNLVPKMPPWLGVNRWHTLDEMPWDNKPIIRRSAIDGKTPAAVLGTVGLWQGDDCEGLWRAVEGMWRACGGHVEGMWRACRGLWRAVEGCGGLPRSREG